MSTKIYYGLRFKAKMLNQFLEAVSAEAIRLTADQIIELFQTIPPEKRQALLLEANARGNKTTAKPDVQLMIYYRYLCEQFKEQSDDWQKGNFLNLQMGWSLFHHKGYFYGWPWGNYVEESHAFAIQFDWVEEYGYWNNVDRPAQITSRQWQQREKNWDALTIPNDMIHRLNYQTIDFEDFSHSQMRILDELEKRLDLGEFTL